MIKTFQEILGTTAAPLPQVAEESQFETLVGTAMNKCSRTRPVARRSPMSTSSPS